jgi:excisionase family DNA binding protein
MTKRDNSAARRLLRLRPASEYLSVSPATVRTLCQQGAIPIIKLTESGHAPWLIDVRDLDDWIERMKMRLE